MNLRATGTIGITSASDRMCGHQSCLLRIGRRRRASRRCQCRALSRISHVPSRAITRLSQWMALLLAAAADGLSGWMCQPTEEKLGSRRVSEEMKRKGRDDGPGRSGKSIGQQINCQLTGSPSSWSRLSTKGTTHSRRLSTQYGIFGACSATPSTECRFRFRMEYTPKEFELGERSHVGSNGSWVLGRRLI